MSLTSSTSLLMDPSRETRSGRQVGAQYKIAYICLYPPPSCTRWGSIIRYNPQYLVQMHEKQHTSDHVMKTLHLIKGFKSLTVGGICFVMAARGMWITNIPYPTIDLQLFGHARADVVSSACEGRHWWLGIFGLYYSDRLNKPWDRQTRISYLTSRDRTTYFCTGIKEFHFLDRYVIHHHSLFQSSFNFSSHIGR